jgi:hypothetical protein
MMHAAIQRRGRFLAAKFPVAIRLLAAMTCWALVSCASHMPAAEPGAAPPLKIATFQVDVTPPLGAPLCDALVAPAAKIDDPLSARGIILLNPGETARGDAKPAAKPIVLCAVDYVGIGNDGNRAWREAIAHAAGTTPDRVAVHTLHQHDAPGCDFSSEALLAAHGLSGQQFHVEDAKRKIEAVAAAVRAAIAKPQPVTHVGFGIGRVERVASSRRVLGEDGKVKYVRFSSCKDASARAAAEGTIDPDVRLVSFWNNDRAIVSMTYYATHPQSYYGKGAVSADFVGLARAEREKALPGVFHLHFNGAGGNVAAGKYNDGSPVNRPQLAARLAAGMKLAFDHTKRTPIAAADLAWETVDVVLPARDTLDEKKLSAELADEKLTTKDRIRAARDLVWLRRLQAKQPATIGCLHLGDARLLYMPGELFVEYQLAAQKIRAKQHPDSFVAMAAYGDYGPGYVGTAIAYEQGGYETSYVSRVGPSAEPILTEAMMKLLK